MVKVLRGGRADWPHAAALTYALGAYASGMAGLFAEQWSLQFIATLLLAHGMVVAAYLVHECAHNTVFVSQAANRRLGAALVWLVGAGYGRYDDLRRKHLRHHAERADVIAYDHRTLLLRHPWLLKAVQTAEWLYVPAVDLLMHALVIVLPFVLPQRRDRRGRVLLQLAIRGSLFAWIGWIAPGALVLYGIAYLLFLHVVRFMDVHQHTYAVFTRLDASSPIPFVGDRAYEFRNTYSNPFSTRRPWLNALVLNFGYHNAHHIHPSTPWHALPGLDAAHRSGDERHLLAFPSLLRSYHRHRVARVLNDDPPDRPIGNPDDFVGVVGVSFLVAH